MYDNVSKNLSERLQKLKAISDKYSDIYEQVLHYEYDNVKGFEFAKTSLPSVSEQAINKYLETHKTINRLIAKLEREYDLAIGNLLLYGHSTGYVNSVQNISEVYNLPFDQLINMPEKQVLSILRELYYERTGTYLISYRYEDYV